MDAAKDVSSAPSASVEARAELDATAADVEVAIVDAEADVSLRDIVERAISQLEDAGNIVAANMASCEAMGEHLEEYKEKHPDAVKQIDMIYQPKYKIDLKKLQPEYRKRFKAAWAKVQPGINKCQQSPKVNKMIHDVWGDNTVDAGPPPW